MRREQSVYDDENPCRDIREGETEVCLSGSVGRHIYCMPECQAESV